MIPTAPDAHPSTPPAPPSQDESDISIPPGVEHVRVLHDAAETAGRLGLIEETVTPAFDGPPLHVHPDFDELFYVLDGELTFQVEDEVRRVRPGETVFAVRGTRHTFANHSDAAARVLIAVTPAGFERYFGLLQARLAGTEPRGEYHGPRPVTEIVGAPIARAPTPS